MSLRSTYSICVLFLLFALPGFCSPVFYADQTSWLNAVASPTTITFENAIGNYSNAAGFTTGLALPDNPTFEGLLTVNGTPGYNLMVLDPSASQYYNFGSGASLWWSPYNMFTTVATLHVMWPSAVNAIAVDLMTYGGNGLSYTAAINGDSSQAYTTNPTPGWPGHTFFGLTSTTGITSIDFYLPVGSTATPLIDNFSYAQSLGSADTGGDPGDTPEPGTLLSISTGLIGLAVIGKRFRQS